MVKFSAGHNNTDLISVHFVNGNTGTSTTPRAVFGTSYNITVVFGTNALQGWRRIESVFKKLARFSNPLAG